MPEDKPDTDFRDTNYRVGFKKYDTYVLFYTNYCI